jgi:hypothetical protein
MICVVPPALLGTGGRRASMVGAIGARRTWPLVAAVAIGVAVSTMVVRRFGSRSAERTRAAG